MDLLTLDRTTFLPKELVEGYTSLIWTERFREAGEWELVTSDINRTRALLPIGSLVTLRDVSEVMFVESHSMLREKDGGIGLKVIGRTFETFLENRVLLPTVYNESWAVYGKYKDSEFISLMLWNHLVNTTGEDPTRTARTQDSKTGIPNVVVTDSGTLTDVTKSWALESGEVYGRFKEILVSSSYGIRAIRPVRSTGNVMTFDTTRTANRGKVTKTVTSNITKLCIDVYNGTDRTATQSVVEPVVLNYGAGHIDSPEYLISNRSFRNMATISASTGTASIWPNVTPPPNQNTTGLDRRTLFVDAGAKGDTQLLADYETAAYQKGYSELAKHQQTSIFDGAMSLLSPFLYQKDYFLGDKISLMGEFGFQEDMYVSEYTRTMDVEGERGYPSLVATEEFEVQSRKTEGPMQ